MAKFKDLSLDLETGEHIDFDDADTIMMGYDGTELYISSTISGVRAAQPYQMVRYDQLTESSGTLQDQIDNIDLEAQDEFIELTDTPTTYSGYSDYIVSVKNDETGLEFIAAAPATLVSGTTPPSTSNIWYNSNDHIIYYYDSSRGAWLSTTSVNYLFSYDGNIDGLYMSVGNVANSYAHFRIIRDATVVSVIADQDALLSSHSTKTFEVHTETVVSGTPTDSIVYSFDMLNHTYTNENLNVDIDSESLLRIWVHPVGAKIRDPIVTLELKWRYAE